MWLRSLYYCLFWYPRKGLLLTSRSHVLKSSSIRKSYPRSSKQCLLYLRFNSFLAERMVSMTISFICGIICSSMSTWMSPYSSFRNVWNSAKETVLPTSCLPKVDLSWTWRQLLDCWRRDGGERRGEEGNGCKEGSRDRLRG